MFNTRAKTPAQYIAMQPPDRRRELARVRQVVRRHLPAGYKEVINWGMISYEIPLKRFPATYNGQPLCFAGLAAQKRHLALYMMAAYGNPKHARALREAFKKAGKKLDMGRSCIRFQSADDLELGAIGRVIAGTPVNACIAFFEKSRTRA